MSFPTRLKAFREQGGLTREQLAQCLQIPTEQVGAWESGAEEPTASQLVALADALGTDADTLLLSGAAAAREAAAHRKRKGILFFTLALICTLVVLWMFFKLVLVTDESFYHLDSGLLLTGLFDDLVAGFSGTPGAWTEHLLLFLFHGCIAGAIVFFVLFWKSFNTCPKSKREKKAHK